VPVIRTVPGVDIKTRPGREPVCRSALKSNGAGHESQADIHDCYPLQHCLIEMGCSFKKKRCMFWAPA